MKDKKIIQNILKELYYLEEKRDYKNKNISHIIDLMQNLKIKELR